MNRPSLILGTRQDRKRHFRVNGSNRLWRVTGSCSLVLGMATAIACGQAITIDKQGNANTGSTAPVDRRFAQIHPTKVPLDNSIMDAKTRQELIRVLQAEQGFAMRPFPRGHKGLTLIANGTLSPAGEDYLNMVTSQGMSAKPGDRVVLSDVKIEHEKIIFDLNGGPDAKHRFLSHIQLGTGTNTAPVVQGDAQGPTGARLTLDFKGHLPAVTGTQVKALLAPMISFDVKTPIEAFTDTLPPKLKEAIISHHVMVGMSTEMVLFAKGPPERKTREIDGQMPFEEWIYGRPPKDVEFVRINGNRVIRVEVAKMGETPVIYTQDEVEGLMRTDGTPIIASDAPGKHTVQMGDVQRDPDTQAPSAPPTLRNPGETIPDATGGTSKEGQMGPVQFPKQKPDDYPDASNLPRTHPAQTSDDDDSDAEPASQDGKKAPSASDKSKPGSGNSGQTQPDASQPH
jgi:hypothetical protein